MRHRENGGIVSFVIIGIVLTGLFVGGLYLSKHQARQARESDTSTPTVVQPEQRSDANQPQSQPAEPQAGTRTQPQPATPTPQRTPNTGPSEALPATGPIDTMLQLIVLSGLTFAAASAVKSRYAVRRSTLK